MKLGIGVECVPVKAKEPAMMTLFALSEHQIKVALLVLLTFAALC